MTTPPRRPPGAPPRRPAGWVAPGPAPSGPQGRADLAPAPDEDLSYLAGDWRVFQKREGHRWSLDDLVTAWVATRALDPATPVRALDLGCGLGSVLLLVAWRMPRADVTGIEAQADRAAMGRRSIAYNGVDARCRIVDGDLRALAAHVEATGFDLVTGTPPYFPLGTGTESDKPHALPCRFEVRGGVEDYLATAAGVVAPTGRIVVCTSTLERARVDAAIATLGLGHVEHWEVVPRTGKPALIAIDVVQLAPASRVDLELTIRDAAGAWTDDMRRVRDDLGLPSRPPDA